MKEQIFICGALRSGSSLTHLMLDNNPNINNPGEFDFLFDQISTSGKFPNMEVYKEWLSTHRIFQSKQLHIDNSLDYPELISSFIAQVTKKNCVLAMNIHRCFDSIPYLFPKAKFIHLIRDPRDVARSSIGMGWAGNVYYGVDHWIETEKSWKRLQGEISPEQYLEIKFEELILSPSIILQRVCDFIGVPYSKRMLNISDNSTYSEPDPSLVNQWETKLSVREIQYIEMKTESLMVSLNYELSGNSLVSIGIIEKTHLKIENKFFKLKFFINRYGFYLFLKDRFSRFLRLKSMQKKARVAMNKISLLHLK